MQSAPLNPCRRPSTPSQRGRAGEGSASLAEGACGPAGLAVPGVPAAAGNRFLLRLPGWRGLARSMPEPARLWHGEIPELHGEALELKKHPQIPVIFLPPVVSVSLLADNRA